MNKHILLYTDDPGVGGVAQYNHSILLELKKRGYQVTSVQGKTANPLIVEQTELGIAHEWLDFDTLKEFDRTFHNGTDATEIFARVEPDLIIFSDGCPVSNFAAKQVALQMGIPYVMVIGFAAPHLVDQFAFCLDIVATQYAAAKAVIAVSQENLNVLRSLYRLPDHKGSVIYYGRPERYFAAPRPATRDRLRRELGIPADGVVCFTAARLEAIKGYQYQLEAIAQLKQTAAWSNLYFVWAGEGQLRDQLQHAIQTLGASDRVTLLGHRWDIADWFDAADLFIFPSELEGMPLAVMEAMAKGIPVMATAVSGIPEELGDTGKLLPDPNSEPHETIRQLATTIQRWATDAMLRQAIGHAGQQRARALFTEMRMVQETMNVLERSLLPQGDYVSPGLSIVQPDAAFPHMVAGDPESCPWVYLRRTVPHTWYVDQRNPIVGFLSRDEAHILYNTALQFKGKRALEIGCWLGWSACHLALAGVELDVVDPLLARPEFLESVSSSLKAAGVLDAVHLVPGYSPQAVQDLAAEHQRKWSLIFIDGNHDAPGPLEDAIACEELAELDAMIVFHDLASPEVTEGLDYLKQQGWNTLVYQTMQIMGVAWRGNITPIAHQPDPTIHWELPSHLQHYTVSGMEQPLVNQQAAQEQVRDTMQQALRLLEMGKPVEALEMADRAVSMGINVSKMHYVRCICLCAVGREKEGLEAARAELAINPNDPQAQAQVRGLTIGLGKDSFANIPTAERPWNTALPPETLQSIQQASHSYAYRGVPMIKNPFDLALYPLLIWQVQPRTIIEIGSKEGGSGLWLGDILNNYGIDGHVYSLDIVEVTDVHHPRVTFMKGNGRDLGSTLTAEFLNTLPRPLLVIEDADHAYETTKAVLEFFHPFLKVGEYIVIEDGIISDLNQDSSYSSGPHLGLKEFLTNHAGEYEIDSSYCDFFGYNITWNTNGYLRKISSVAQASEQTAIASKSLPQALKLREINLIVFPDWSQTEETIFNDLVEVLRATLPHWDRQRITLLIDISSADPEQADMVLSGAIMHLLTEENIEVSEDGPEISPVNQLSSAEWETLLPYLSGRVILEREEQKAIATTSITNIPAYTPEELAITEWG